MSLAFQDTFYSTNNHDLPRSFVSFLMVSLYSVPWDKGSKLTLPISSNPFFYLL